MCLQLTNRSAADLEKLRASKTPITAYKIVRVDGKGKFFPKYQWTQGLNQSNRKTSQISIDEYEEGEILKGFHLLLNKPEVCGLWPLHCHPLWVCGYDGYMLCTHERATRNRVLKCTVQPEDIVAVGEWWGLYNCIAATKAWVEDDNVRS